MRNKTRLAWVAVLMLGAPAAFAAEGRNHHWAANGAWVGNPSVLSGAGSWAGELSLGRMFQPWAYTAIFAGPRFGVMAGNRAGLGFLNAALGGEAQLWLVNIAGPGVAADWVLPLNAEEARSADALLRYRVEAFMGLRVKRIGDLGALSVRAGAYYDRLWGMGLKAGISLALGGVALQ